LKLLPGIKTVKESKLSFYVKAKVPTTFEIVPAQNTRFLELAKLLFKEYAASLGIDLSFQHFEEELANLPAGYMPPEGYLLLATVGEQAAGCVAVRKLEDDICEMKRLYVKPQFRSMKIGKALAEAAIEEAKRLEYKLMRLDTLPAMAEAQKSYLSLGFKKIAPYRFNPVEGTVYMELKLSPVS
jgi:ribosomal protein S18 acetylase RimI-like enzyme